MPASGPVYQPTTVTYEQQSDWTPVSYLSQTVNNGVNRSKCLKWLLLVVGLFCLAAGLIMLVEGAVDYSKKQQEKEEKDTTSDLAIAITGGVLTVVGILFLGFYIRVARRRKGCPCFPSKDQRLARQLDNHGTNGQILTLNPSTDLLVTAQYGPVSEIAYQPPAVSEEEETRKLMGSDNKECTNMPTIVPKLRKISTSSTCFPGRHLAPLATGEEVTPSLRSSFASVYYNITPYESEISLNSACSN